MGAIRWSRTELRCLAAVLVLVCTVPGVLAGGNGDNVCDPGESPDVIVADLHQIDNYGMVGDISAFSIGTTSCNIGTCGLQWIEQSNLHPVIGQNVYRYRDGRFEHVGQGWLKHGFFALSGGLCFNDCIPTPGDVLGVHCSDPYSAFLNGQQGRLGPRSDVNAATGSYTWPFPTQGQTGDAIYKRVQVHNDDLDETLHPGAAFFVEGQYVTKDDTAAGNGGNNASWRPVKVELLGGIYQMTLRGSTVREEAAIQAWPTLEAGVQIAETDVPGDGKLYVGSNATPIDATTWHYEYAVQNLTSHRSVQSFSVPLPAGATPTNVGFHDVDYHSGEPYDLSDWSWTVDGDTITWSSKPFDENPNANALRWGTLYNFRFDLDVAPVSGEVDLGLFRPGNPPGVVVGGVMTPDVCVLDGVCSLGETCTNCAADCSDQGGLGGCCGDGTCDPGEDACICDVDCGPAPAFELVCDDGVDDDCDGDLDCVDPDCCGDPVCGATCCGGDLDGDSFEATCDCDDANGSAWATPGEVQDLTLGHDAGTGTTSLAWSPPAEPGGSAVVYETLRSGTASDFVGGGQCLADPGSDTEAPAGGDLFHYLVRATNACPLGVGPLGESSGGTQRSGTVCP